MSSGDVVLIQRRLPPELDGWVVVRAREEPTPGWAGPPTWVVWLERMMPDGTTLRFEAVMHDVDTELPMLVPVIAAVTVGSAPNLRLSVTRTRTTRFEVERSKDRRRLTE